MGGSISSAHLPTNPPLFRCHLRTHKCTNHYGEFRCHAKAEGRQQQREGEGGGMFPTLEHAHPSAEARWWGARGPRRVHPVSLRRAAPVPRSRSRVRGSDWRLYGTLARRPAPALRVGRVGSTVCRGGKVQTPLCYGCINDSIYVSYKETCTS